MPEFEDNWEEEVDLTPLERPLEQNVPPTNIEEGWYVARITGVERRRSKRSQKKYLAWELKIDGQHPKFRVWFVTLLEGPGIWAFRELMWALVGTRPKGKCKIRPKAWLGAEICVKLGYDSYLGDIRNAVRKVTPLAQPTDDESALSRV
jgi:hypothetical protein